MMKNYDAAVSYIQTKLQAVPEVGIILGSGMQNIVGNITNPVVIAYEEIPGFASATAPNHAGTLIAGELRGKQVVCMKGRFHFYEGHAAEDIIFPVRVLWLLGARTLIVTNAAGGINQSFRVGDIMQIRDHINLTGTNPLIGANDPRFGGRFFDMTHAYDHGFFALAESAAEDCGIALQSGVYLGCTGPSFETPAEIVAFRTLGADAVGMSTVFEVIAASQMNMRVLGFSMITNMAAGMTGEALNGDEVIAVGNSGGAKLQALIERILEKL
ncbi:MAG: purine-nucleoside phosphorylase [Oscillospiraceae bacterium]|jgi:purine-nucleoside phosphorylase|nr:purine-nucleoside phosphorylase [Oscillospiraceae bacterium]